MTTQEYQKLSARTLSHQFYDVDHDVLHAITGLVTEAGELMSDVKKSIYYGAPLNRGHLLDEAGDLCWYLATLFNALQTDFEYVMMLNIVKLQKRYPEKFTSEQALNKDSEAESEIYWEDNLAAPFRHLEPKIRQLKPKTK